jgi:hypothetical protein
MLAVHETDELTKLGCDMDSKVTDVFARIPGRMKKPPADAAKIFAAVAAAVEEEYQVDTLSEMMELILVGQFEKLLTEAGGKATWIAWLEMIFGMRFKTGSSAPPSSQLLMHNSGNALPTNCKPTFEVKPIGALMLEAGTLANEILPEYIFEAITECEDVTAQQISAKDLTAVLDKYQHYMITHHKQPHGDKVLRSHHAKQLKARIPHLPDHGKIAGAVRKFDKILHERKRNFSRTKSLKVGPPELCPSDDTPHCRAMAHLLAAPGRRPSLPTRVCGAAVALPSPPPWFRLAGQGLPWPHVHPGGGRERFDPLRGCRVQAAHRRAHRSAQLGAPAAAAQGAAAGARPHDKGLLPQTGGWQR